MFTRVKHQPVVIYHTIIRQLSLFLRLSFDLHENRSHGEHQTRPMCCLEPDDVQNDLSLYGYGQIIELNDFYVVYAVPSAPMLCYDWRPRVTDCAIVSPRSQLHAVLTVAIPGRHGSLMVSTTG